MRVMTGIYDELATCKVWTGHADEGLALQEEADQLNPLSPWKYMRYQEMGTSPSDRRWTASRTGSTASLRRRML